MIWIASLAGSVIGTIAFLGVASFQYVRQVMYSCSCREQKQTSDGNQYVEKDDEVNVKMESSADVHKNDSVIEQILLFLLRRELITFIIIQVCTVLIKKN